MSRVLLSANDPAATPTVTRAEGFYYQKQIDTEATLVFVLLDGRDIRGRLRWFDTESLGVVARNGQAMVVPKRHVKYLFKLEEQARLRGSGLAGAGRTP